MYELNAIMSDLCLVADTAAVKANESFQIVKGKMRRKEEEDFWKWTSLRRNEVKENVVTLKEKCQQLFEKFEAILGEGMKLKETGSERKKNLTKSVKRKGKVNSLKSV